MCRFCSAPEARRKRRRAERAPSARRTVGGKSGKRVTRSLTAPLPLGGGRFRRYLRLPLRPPPCRTRPETIRPFFTSNSVTPRISRGTPFAPRACPMPLGPHHVTPRCGGEQLRMEVGYGLEQCRPVFLDLLSTAEASNGMSGLLTPVVGINAGEKCLPQRAGSSHYGGAPQFQATPDAHLRP